MASIWLRLNSIPTEEFMTIVVAPLVRALGDNGIHPNLEATENSIYNNEGNLAYA